MALTMSMNGLWPTGSLGTGPVRTPKRETTYESAAQGTAERLGAFSDGVFAVLITVLALDLRPPEAPTFAVLFMLWPAWLSYGVNYAFIAIVWVNHHCLMR